MVKITAISMMIFSALSYASQDPTAPIGWQASKTVQQKQAQKRVVEPLPHLQSIICLEDKACYAILNDKIVERGKYVQGYLTKRIEPEFVDLVKSGKQWRLELFPSDVKH